MKKKNWFKKTFTVQRVFTSIKFSAIIGVTYWATTVYERAFEMSSPYWAILAFILVSLVLLLFGGSLLDAISKD